MSAVETVDRLARAMLDANFKLRPVAGLPLKEVEAVALAAGAIVELESAGFALVISPGGNNAEHAQQEYGPSSTDGGMNNGG